MAVRKDWKELYGRGEGIRGVLLLFVILIGAALVVLGLMSFLSKISEPIPSFEIVSLEGGKILVKNTGEAAIKKGELSVYINNQKIDAANEDIQPGQAGAIQINESKADALISVRLGEQTKSMPAPPAITTTTTIPDKICPAVCVPMWRLDKNSCIYTDCGSGCGPDNVATFGTETECKQKIAATSTTIPSNTPLTTKLEAPETAIVNKIFSVTVRAQSGRGIERAALFYDNKWHYVGCAGNQVCASTWNITERDSGPHSYYGYVHDSKGGNWTSPKSVSVIILNIV